MTLCTAWTTVTLEDAQHPATRFAWSKLPAEHTAGPEALRANPFKEALPDSCQGSEAECGSKKVVTARGKGENNQLLLTQTLKNTF